MRRRLTTVGVAAALGASVLVPVQGAASEPLATNIDVGVDSVQDVTKALDDVLDEAPAVIEKLLTNTAAAVEDLEIDPDGDVVIDGPRAPTAFDFTVDFDGTETLTLQPDGSVYDFRRRSSLRRVCRWQLYPGHIEVIP